MQQTISGETHSFDYVRVNDKKLFNKELINLCQYLQSNILDKKIYYNSKNKNFNLDSLTYNLINTSLDCQIKKSIKDLLITEAYSIDTHYPGAGDTFLELIINYYTRKSKTGSVNEYVEDICKKN